MNVTDVINCVVGIIALGTSIVAMCISVRSVRRQYKIDLFTKRSSYYYACDIICACCISGMEDIVEKRFKAMGIDIGYYDVLGAKFLFEGETAEFISSIFFHWTFYQDTAYFLKNYNGASDPNGELFEQSKKLHEEAKSFFNEARVQLFDKFEKYLRLSY